MISTQHIDRDRRTTYILPGEIPLKMSLPTSEQVQTFVLKTLDIQGSIVNSNDLVLNLENGQKITFVAGESQTLLKGALDSLASREVSALSRRIASVGSPYSRHAGTHSSDALIRNQDHL